MPKMAKLTIHHANWLFVFLVIGWGGLIGSGIMVLVIGALIWNLGALALGRLDLAVEREAGIIAALFAAFFAAMALSNVLNHTFGDAAEEIGRTLPFLGLILLYAALCRSTRATIAQAARYGAVSGAYATFALVVFQSVFFDVQRAEGFAGNPGPLSVIAGLLYSVCILIAVERPGGQRILAWGAAGSAAAILLMTGMRGAWPILVVGALLPCVVYGRAILRDHLKGLVVLVAVLVAAFLAVWGQSVPERVSHIAADIEQITTENNFDSSIGHRMAMWATGLDLIQERPLLGHGSAAMRELMRERTQALGYPALGYSHFHNFLINTAVHSGIVGLALLLAMFIAPIWMAFRTYRRDTTATFGFGMMLSLYATFAISGASNIMLHHDILDALFVFGTVASCFLVFRRNDALSA